jgi:hypothetical protein
LTQVLNEGLIEEALLLLWHQEIVIVTYVFIANEGDAAAAGSQGSHAQNLTVVDESQ